MNSPELLGLETNSFQRSDGGVQSLLRVTRVHQEEEAFGKLRTDAPGRGGDALSSADQKVRQQRDLLMAALAQIISLGKDEEIFNLNRRTYMNLFQYVCRNVSLIRTENVLT